MRLKMFTFSLSMQIPLSHIIKISQPECCWQFYFNNIQCLLKLPCERCGPTNNTSTVDARGLFFASQGSYKRETNGHCITV